MNAAQELEGITGRLEAFSRQGDSAEIVGPMSALRVSAEEVGKSASGSWIGYQALVYYEGFVRPPPRAHFDQEWGWKGIAVGTTVGSWREYTHEIVLGAIYKEAGNPDLSGAREFDDAAKEAIEECRSETLSILEIHAGDGQHLESLRKKIKELSTWSREDIINALAPRSGKYIRDNVAFDQGPRTPPHIYVQAEILAMQRNQKVIADLRKSVKQCASHVLRRQQAVLPQKSNVGTKVFIGHGHSTTWRELEDFIKEGLGLPTDEFNREPTAGTLTFDRLEQMLNSAAVAFLVMTAEDEQKEGKSHPRLNVVHEAGLFQGRLGPRRAIILMEDGCEEFSNIAGLGQLRFRKGDIRATFREIEDVLEREGLLGGRQRPTP